MASFSYLAVDRSGKRTEGVVDAADRRAAQLMIERSGRIPVSIRERAKQEVAAKTEWWKLSAGTSTKMKMREVLLFTEELSDLLAAGMTLADALNSLAGHGDTPSARVAADLRDRIIKGDSLSTAVRAHPESFPALYGNMISAGEASGAVSDVLQRLIEHYNRILEMRGRIVQALTYPIVVIILGICTIIYAMVKVVPQFLTIFKNMKTSLPASTKILISTSEFVQHNIVFIVIGAALAGVLVSRILKTPGGRLFADRMKLRLPLVKGIVANGLYAQFARTLQTLLANGVTVLSALKITEETVGNAVIAEEIRHVRSRVTDGTTISGPLAAGGVFPRMMTDLIAIGEKTGDMPSALGHIGRRYESEMDRNIKIFTAALEPILIVMVALVVGFIAISILSAVFKVTSGLN